MISSEGPRRRRGGDGLNRDHAPTWSIRVRTPSGQAKGGVIHAVHSPVTFPGNVRFPLESGLQMRRGSRPRRAISGNCPSNATRRPRAPYTLGMSAIFGILRFDTNHVSHDDLEWMASALARRGPDGRQFVTAGAVGLGHCLMHVNAEDRFEVQPLYDPETDVTLVADCRIDNRQELAGILGIAHARLSRTPDSAFILHAYKKWGAECATHLLGDFAFAVWDGRARKLLLARDQMGQRYVHYHCNSKFFVFATEIKGLWISPRSRANSTRDS